MSLLGLALVLSEFDMLNVLLLIKECLQYKPQIDLQVELVVSFSYLLSYSNCSSISVNTHDGMESSTVVLATDAYARVKNALNYYHWRAL